LCLLTPAPLLKSCVCMPAMVYIEDRISELEKTVKLLQNQLSDAVEDLKSASDKRRKLDHVTRDQLDKAVADIHEVVSKKVDKDDVDKVVQEIRTLVNKAVSEERLNQAVLGMQTAMDQKVGNSVSQDQLNQAVATISADSKATRDQLTSTVASLQSVLHQRAQAAISTCESLRLTVQSNRERLDQVSAALENTNQQWRDVDLNDSSMFDPSKMYRLRIGDGMGSRWLYSTDVSLNQIYTSCNILDQSIVVNSNTKSSYGARRVGADVNSTAYYVVFQLQCKTS